MIEKVILLCFAALATVQANPLGRVISGVEAPVGAFPWQVSMQYGYSFSPQHICGGSILNSRWVLTAGHCYTEIPQIPDMTFSVRVGIHSLSGDKGQTVRVRKVWVHPEYEGGVAAHDIALLELRSELNLSAPHVQIVTLPKKDAIPTGETTLSGWGSISTTEEIIQPDKLMTVDLPIISNAECQAELNSIAGDAESLAETNVCTGILDKGEGACSGDSGGPLVAKSSNTLVGVVSWGLTPCGRAPSVFTRVSAYIDWINSVINH